MGQTGLKKVLGRLRQSLLPLDGGDCSDAQLLGQFVERREEAAFAALVHRHGPMVLGVCNRVLGHRQDAEDAFQAAFLVLARKAGSVLRREALASFLYGVAYRTALRARSRATQRRMTERQVEAMPEREVAPPPLHDWQPLLDHELQRLPAKYRAPVLLCDLEGKTRREAARVLGLSEGTLSSRLSRARRMLAQRLCRRGVAVCAGALAASLAESAAPAALPRALVVSTIKAATLVAAGQAACVATPVAALMNEVLGAMLMTKLKLPVMGLMVALALAGSNLVYRAAGQAPGNDKPGATRALSELELLRKEMQILKLQVELMQAEVQALKTKGIASAAPQDNKVQLWDRVDQKFVGRVIPDVVMGVQPHIIQQEASGQKGAPIVVGVTVQSDKPANEAVQNVIDQVIVLDKEGQKAQVHVGAANQQVPGAHDITVTPDGKKVIVIGKDDKNGASGRILFADRVPAGKQGQQMIIVLDDKGQQIKLEGAAIHVVDATTGKVHALLAGPAADADEREAQAALKAFCKAGDAKARALAEVRLQKALKKLHIRLHTQDEKPQANDQ
jgi:RNA polymerase sigma factor (sigma-70 family)